jgi:hypothetical protein
VAKSKNSINENGAKNTGNFEEVDLNSIQQIKPRTVGAEHVSLEALKDLQIPQINPFRAPPLRPKSGFKALPPKAIS